MCLIDPGNWEIEMRNIPIISIFVMFICCLLAAQGPQRTALDFGTSNDSLYVLVQDNISLDATTAVTLEAWVYFRDTPGIWNVVVEKAYDEYGMYVRSNRVINFYTTGTFGTISLDGKTVLDTATWYHMAGTYDSTSGTANVYINGHLDATVTGFPGVIDTTMQPLRIGDDRDNDTAFDGLIDEVRVWNIARDSLEIQATMNSVLGAEYYNTTDSGLIAYWRFDEAEGDTAYDLSVYGNHGEIRGATFSEFTAPLGMANHKKILPGEYQLLQNYPNPFNPSTTIEFSLPKSEFIELKVFNILGKEVATLVSNKLNSGNHTYTFDGKNLASGIYYYQLVAGDYRDVKKMILLR